MRDIIVLFSWINDLRSRCPFLLSDEMIRQIAVNCTDQGLLLYRIRNEFRLTLRAYATIYDSSVHFGLRQALRNELRYSNMQTQVCQALHYSHCVRLESQLICRPV